MYVSKLKGECGRNRRKFQIKLINLYTIYKTLIPLFYASFMNRREQKNLEKVSLFIIIKRKKDFNEQKVLYLEYIIFLLSRGRCVKKRKRPRFKSI